MERLEEAVKGWKSFEAEEGVGLGETGVHGQALEYPTMDGAVADFDPVIEVGREAHWPMEVVQHLKGAGRRRSLLVEFVVGIPLELDFVAEKLQGSPGLEA